MSKNRRRASIVQVTNEHSTIKKCQYAVIAAGEVIVMLCAYAGIIASQKFTHARMGWAPK
jgi:hypothetical protein